jgi:hypothetical protein
VRPVDPLGVVLRLHITDGNSSAQDHAAYVAVLRGVA